MKSNGITYRMSAFKLIVLKGEKIFYSKNPEKNSEKKKKMRKHIYTNAFICVGRYSAPQKRRLIVIVLIYA